MELGLPQLAPSAADKVVAQTPGDAAWVRARAGLTFLASLVQACPTTGELQAATASWCQMDSFICK